MAAPNNAGTYLFDSYTRTSSNQEDLVDWIANVDPYETPLTVSLGRTVARSSYHQWQTDTLRSRNARGIIEGNDWTSAAASAPVRVTNITEIFGDDIAVTETEKAENPAGFGDAYAYQLEKACKSTLVDIEAAILATATGGVTGTSAAARVMKNLEGFAATNTATAADYITAGGTGSAGMIGAVDITNMLQEVWDSGGNVDLIVCNGAYKRQISSFTQNNTRFIPSVDKKVVAGIDVYDSDFGLVPIQLNRWCPASTNTSTASASATDVRGRIWFLQRSLVRLAWLRPLQHNLMGKRGDSTVGQVRAELTLEVGNEKGIGVMKGVNNKLTGVV